MKTLIDRNEDKLLREDVNILFEEMPPSCLLTKAEDEGFQLANVNALPLLYPS